VLSKAAVLQIPSAVGLEADLDLHLGMHACVRISYDRAVCREHAQRDANRWDVEGVRAGEPAGQFHALERSRGCVRGVGVLRR